MKNRMRNMFRGCVLVFFLVGGFGATLQAAPMFGETMEFRQPDGTEISGKDSNTVTFTTPNEPNKTLHLILELRDNGTPNLFSYRRTIVTITKSALTP